MQFAPSMMMTTTRTSGSTCEIDDRQDNMEQTDKDNLDKDNLDKTGKARQAGDLPRRHRSEPSDRRVRSELAVAAS